MPPETAERSNIRAVRWAKRGLELVNPPYKSKPEQEYIELHEVISPPHDQIEKTAGSVRILDNRSPEYRSWTIQLVNNNQLTPEANQLLSVHTSDIRQHKKHRVDITIEGAKIGGDKVKIKGLNAEPQDIRVLQSAALDSLTDAFHSQKISAAEYQKALDKFQEIQEGKLESIPAQIYVSTPDQIQIEPLKEAFAGDRRINRQYLTIPQGKEGKESIRILVAEQRGDHWAVNPELKNLTSINLVGNNQEAKKTRRGHLLGSYRVDITANRQPSNPDWRQSQDLGLNSNSLDQALHNHRHPQLEIADEYTLKILQLKLQKALVQYSTQLNNSGPLQDLHALETRGQFAGLDADHPEQHRHKFKKITEDEFDHAVVVNNQLAVYDGRNNQIITLPIFEPSENNRLSLTPTALILMEQTEVFDASFRYEGLTARGPIYKQRGVYHQDIYAGLTLHGFQFRELQNAVWNYVREPEHQLQFDRETVNQLHRHMATRTQSDHERRQRAANERNIKQTLQEKAMAQQLPSQLVHAAQERQRTSDRQLEQLRRQEAAATILPLRPAEPQPIAASAPEQRQPISFAAGSARVIARRSGRPVAPVGTAEPHAATGTAGRPEARPAPVFATSERPATVSDAAHKAVLDTIYSPALPSRPTSRPAASPEQTTSPPTSPESELSTPDKEGVKSPLQTALEAIQQRKGLIEQDNSDPNTVRPLEQTIVTTALEFVKQRLSQHPDLQQELSQILVGKRITDEEERTQLLKQLDSLLTMNSAIRIDIVYTIQQAIEISQWYASRSEPFKPWKRPPKQKEPKQEERKPKTEPPKSQPSPAKARPLIVTPPPEIPVESAVKISTPTHASETESPPAPTAEKLVATPEELFNQTAESLRKAEEGIEIPIAMTPEVFQQLFAEPYPLNSEGTITFQSTGTKVWEENNGLHLYGRVTLPDGSIEEDVHVSLGSSGPFKYMVSSGTGDYYSLFQQAFSEDAILELLNRKISSQL